MHRSVLENADFMAWANENVVLVVGHDGSKHKSAKSEKTGDKDGKDDAKDGGDAGKEGADSSLGEKPAGGAASCSLYPGLTCEEHEKLVEDAKSGTPALSFSGWPTSFMI